MSAFPEPQEVENVKSGVWNPDQWHADVAAQGPELVKIFESIDYAHKACAMIAAYNAEPKDRLMMMVNATGNIEETSDINYVWTSEAKVALLLEPGRNLPETMPEEFGEVTFVRYDDKLRAWVADVSSMHAELLQRLAAELVEVRENQHVSQTQVEQELVKELEEFDANNICELGDWVNGIALTPSKHFMVTKWIKKYYQDFFCMANKMIFFKVPATTRPPFVQIKVHLTCFYFKGPPGSVLVNPEFAEAGVNKLRDDLDESVYTEKQFTVEIIGGRPHEFPDGVNGKLTCIDSGLFVIPMAPKNTMNFDTLGPATASNSYAAFKKSHPVC